MKVKDLFRTIICFVCLNFLCVCMAADAGETPEWWYTRGLVDTNLPADDFSAVNIGQLKHVAHQTWLEISNRLAQIVTDDTDADSSNELNTALGFTNNILTLTDAGGDLAADLSSLVDIEGDPVWVAASNSYSTTAEADAFYMSKTGDTMTGDLAVRSRLVVGTGMATGLNAVAQGHNTLAGGTFSHAQGYQTTASGAYSHAKGRFSTSSGTASHAEGFGTLASGAYSHAEGHGTTASGIDSHAEGWLTVASGYASHAAGFDAKATNDHTYVWSDGTEVGSTTTRQFTVHAQNGIRLLGGPISGDGSGLTNLNIGAIAETDPTVPASVKDGISWTEISGRPFGLDDGDDVGLTSESDPQVGSISQNYVPQWNGSSLVTGTIYDNGNVGIGTSSPGKKLDVAGDMASTRLVVGYANSANGSYASAFGYNSHASGEYAMAQGYGASATGDNGSHAEGYYTSASGNNGAHAEGYYSTASGAYSHAEGENTTAQGVSSHAAGTRARALHHNTFVWNDGLTLAGSVGAVDSSTTREFTVHASNGIRLLGGPISGDGSGLTNLSETDPTVPAGIKDGISWTEISGRPSGLDDGDDVGLTSESDPQVGTISQNYLSKWNGSALVTGTIYDNGNVGIGTSSPDKKLTVHGDIASSGDLTGTRLIVGSGSSAIGAYAAAFGYYCHASGDTSHVEGNQNTASGYGSHAEGGWTTASGTYSHAEGESTTAGGSRSHAAGVFAKALHDNTYVWNDGLTLSGTSGTIDSSTTREFTLHASNGIRLMGGGTKYVTISGSGGEPYLIPSQGHYGYLGTQTHHWWKTYSAYYYAENANNYLVYSDARIKENIRSLDGSLEKVSQLRGVRYDLKEAFFKPTEKEDPDAGRNHLGFIAQELEEIIPEVVGYDEDSDLKTVAYQSLVPVLVEAIKELKAQKDEEIETLQVGMAELIERLEALERE